MLPGFLTMLHSAYENLSRDIILDAKLLVQGWKKKDKDILKNLASRLKRCNLEIIDANTFKLLKGTSFHGSNAPYLIFLAPEISDNKKTVYLDPDTIILTDLGELLSIELETSPIGAVVQSNIRNAWTKERDTLVSMGVPESSPYFNTGVVVFNKDEWESQEVRKRAFDIIKRGKYRLHTADQTLMNAVVQNQVYSLPKKYNIRPKNFRYPPEKIDRHDGIYHFVGSPKPWDPLGKRIHPHYDYFECILKRTGYSSPPRRNLTIANVKRVLSLTRSYWKCL